MAALERKDIEDLTELELATYEHAMGKLMDDLNPLTNYQRHADFHNVFGNNPPRGCEHRNDLFFPWHRFHLLNFERALQLSDPDHSKLSTANVTIPYWNWSRQPQTGVRYPLAFENPESRLHHGDRNGEAEVPMFSESYITQLLRENADWAVFAGGPKNGNEFFGALESPAHNEMHGTFIGGLMADPFSAAEDPIYWSFHAFIDRLWERWSRVHGGTATCLDCVLRGFPTAPRADDVHDTEMEVSLEGGVTTLGYRYTFAPEEIEQLSRFGTATEADLFRAMVAVPGRQEQLFRLTPAETPMSFDLPQLDEVPSRAALWLVKLTPPSRLSYRLDVYLHPRELQANASGASDRQYLIGEFAFWKAHHLLPGQTAGAVLNVTPAMRRYAGDSVPYRLTIVPVALADSGAPNPHHDHHDQDHGGGGGEGVAFEGLALQLNANGVPDLVLGEVPHHG